MPSRHLFPIAFALIAYCAAQTPLVMAQTTPNPATKQPAPNQAVMGPMVFYEAHGEANACGPGCSEWIAAEGKIDKGAPDRLEHLLAHIKGPPPPLFFQSPGGLVTDSMLLGQLIRSRKLTVSVGHTVPLHCDRGPAGQESCEAELSAGGPVEAELDYATAMCNSACVYALAGGFVRLIPPWVALGIHDIGFDPSIAAIRHASTLALEAAKAATDERLHKYVHQMGIGDGLLTEAFATPYSSVERLTRDDAARFGLDRREFGEAVWQFVDKPQPTIRKLFFVRADDSKRSYVNAVVSLSCLPWLGTGAIAMLAREHLGSETETAAGQPIVNLRLNGQDIRLGRTTYAKLYQWGGQVAFKSLEGVSDDGTMLLPGPELGRQEGSAGDVTLAMTGFSAAHAKWQKVCAESARQARSAQAATGMPPLPSLLQSSQVAGALPPSRSNPVGIGASRYVVDATLGAPTETVGSTALYSYASSSGESKVIAGYFDKSARLQRLARYVLKDGKVFDEISQTELGEGQELVPVRHLLADPHSGAGLGQPVALPGWTSAH